MFFFSFKGGGEPESLVQANFSVWKLPSLDCKQGVLEPPKSQAPLEYNPAKTKSTNPVTTKLDYKSYFAWKGVEASIIEILIERRRVT